MAVIRLETKREEYNKKSAELKHRKKELKKQGQDVYEIKTKDTVLLIWKNVG